MHGLVFTAFRTFTESEYPEATEAIWAGAPRHLLTSAYPDEDFEEYVGRASEAVGETRERVLRRFGIFAALSTFRLLYPDYYASHAGALDFLLGVEERIHETVRKTIEGARPPHLVVTRVSDDAVMIAYTSSRRLCALLDGLVAGVGRYYGDRLRVEETTCALRGDPAGCSFVVTRA